MSGPEIPLHPEFVYEVPVILDFVRAEVRKGETVEVLEGFGEDRCRVRAAFSHRNEAFEVVLDIVLQHLQQFFLNLYSLLQFACPPVFPECSRKQHFVGEQRVLVFLCLCTQC